MACSAATQPRPGQAAPSAGRPPVEHNCIRPDRARKARYQQERRDCWYCTEFFRPPPTRLPEWCMTAANSEQPDRCNMMSRATTHDWA